MYLTVINQTSQEIEIRQKLLSESRFRQTAGASLAAEGEFKSARGALLGMDETSLFLQMDSHRFLGVDDFDTTFRSGSFDRKMAHDGSVHGLLPDFGEGVWINRGMDESRKWMSALSEELALQFTKP